MKVKLFLFLLISIFVFGCSGNFKETPDDKFVGTWEMKGRDMFDGIQIIIAKKDNKLVGRISKLNANKYVKLFADSNDVWVSEIKRTSNFEFKLTEKKIGRDLFSMYGLSTSQEYRVQFIDDNTIGLASDNTDPLLSTTIYKRLLQKE
jgi:hypothetical protein